jgi:hypothetical protein
MSGHEEIREGLIRLAGNFGPSASLLGEVVSVDEDAGVCVINDGDVDVYDVRLRPVITGNQGVTMFPAVGSFVLAIRIEQDEEWMVIGAESIEKYRIVAGDLTLEMDGEKYQIKTGTDDLKQILNDLIEAIKNEKHMTNTGVSIAMTAASIAVFTAIDTRINSMFKS